MGLFGSRNRRSNQKPVEVARASENLSIALWQAAESDGRTRYHFKIQRVSEDGASQYATLRPKDLLEMPEAIAAAASCFARVPQISAELREELAGLAQVMEQIAARRKANGFDPEEHPRESRVFGN